MPLIVVEPAAGVIVNPVLNLSKFRYFVVWTLSIALITVSAPGLLFDVGVIVSDGEVMSTPVVPPRSPSLQEKASPGVATVAGVPVPMTDTGPTRPSDVPNVSRAVWRA